MRDKITLGDDVFSAEYWQHDRVRSLVEAFGDMLDDSTSTGTGAYVEWWLKQTGGTYTSAMVAAASYCKLLSDIRHDGYDAKRWKTSDRNFDPAKGQGPITVKIGPDGKITPWDGAHRSAILRCLGRPVEAEVFERAPEWQHLKEYHATLYTPYPHPDFASHPVTRRGTERFQPISGVIKADSNRIGARIAVVGACTGFGAIELAKAGFIVTAIEPNDKRCSLIRYLAARDREIPTLNLSVSESLAHEHDYFRYDSVLGYSVYQHVATSVDRWNAVCNLLAKCPQHIIELPGNHEHQWHDKFREETGGKPQEAIISMLIQAGGYDPPKVIYTDHTYANRQTILLERP